jgi:hypothetical protein
MRLLTLTMPSADADSCLVIASSTLPSDGVHEQDLRVVPPDVTGDTMTTSSMRRASPQSA